MDSIFVSMNIHFLKDFLENINEVVSAELEEIESKCKNGETREYDDYENLIDYPLFRAEFGAKAIFYELNAMVESQLHDKATPRFLIENKENGKYKKKKSASELGYSDLLNIIESEYGSLENGIENWSEYVRLRKSVNSFKHNRGFRKHSDYERNIETEGINWKWTATLEQAEKYLDVIPGVIDGIRSLGAGKASDKANSADANEAADLRR